MKRVIRGEELDFVCDVDPNLGGIEWDTVADWCLRNVGPEDTFIDIGANIGYIATLVQRFSKPKFSIFVEPEAKTAMLLRANLAKNAKGNYQVIETVVLDKPGKADFWICLENSARSSVFDRTEVFEFKQKVSIPATTVDEIIEQFDIQGPVVLKIDAEMAEPLIWEGMKKSVPKIKSFVMEYYPEGLNKHCNIDPPSFLKRIRDAGFREQRLNGNNLVFDAVPIPG